MEEWANQSLPRSKERAMEPYPVTPKAIIRIVSWSGTISAFRCPVFYVKPVSGRIICAVTGTVHQGLKPARLRQFNQWSGGRERVLLTTEDSFAADLERFQRKTGIHQQVVIREVSPHPLWDVMRGRAARKRDA